MKSLSLPAGILNNINLTTYDKDIEDQDILVMCSDGILDSNVEYKNKELWVKYVLEDIEIGKDSFKSSNGDNTMISHTTYIRDCRGLKRCQFNDGAFGFPSKKLLLQSILKLVVLIVDLPALEELTFGEHTFSSHQSLQVTSLLFK